MDAIRGQTRVLIAVGFLALLAGGAVAHWRARDIWIARAAARIAYEPHAVLSRNNEAQLLASAAARAGSDEAELKKQVKVRFGGRDRLTVEARGADEQSARQLAEEIASGFVTLANARAESVVVAQDAAHNAELAKAHAARDQAQNALLRAMPAQQAEAEARLRAQLDELDQALQAALVAPQPARSGSRINAADAQRQLSRLLANGAGEEEVNALRAKIARAQRAGEAGAATPIRPLQKRVEAKRAELAAVAAADSSLLPLRQKVQAADDEIEALASRVEPAPSSSSLEGTPLVERQSRALVRWLATLLAPMIALLMLLVMMVLRELTDLRVCEPTELAHWMSLPVLTSSTWPNQGDQLESLVDTLADPALESLGTTLILPLSEVERPLAWTLTLQLNARAQRQFRSRTGSRVTIAQHWQGELDSSRIGRAAEAADRVLWVVAADAHHGAALASRRALIRRKDGVAAILVDAESTVVRTVGAASEFWNARTSAPVSEIEPLREPTASHAVQVH